MGLGLLAICAVAFYAFLALAPEELVQGMLTMVWGLMLLIGIGSIIASILL